MPAGDRAERLPLGVLPVDAIFSPIRRVNWSVSNARVGQDTNFDRLNLDIWTDGTITPEEALEEAVDLLIQHLSIIRGVEEEPQIWSPAPMEPENRLSNEAAETPIEALDLTVRVYNALKCTGVSNVRDVLDLLDKGESAMLAIRNFGDKSLAELKAKMIEKGFLDEEEAE